MQRGEIWRLKGDLDKSLADLNKAVELNPSSPVSLSYRGETLRRMGKLPAALDDFNKSIRLVPDAIIAYTGRGLTYEDMGNSTAAIADFQKALTFSGDLDGSLGHDAQGKARERLAALQVGEREPKAPPTQGARPPTPGKLPPTQGGSAIRGPGADDADANKPIVPAARASGERRVALVIGNASYRAIPQLPNTGAAADAIGEVLRKLGFQSVTVERDLTHDQLVDTLRAFQDQADGADWAVIYYAGHAMQMGGVNYLIPIDAQLRADQDVETETIALDRIIAGTKGAKKLRLVMLDAYGENPFLARMRRTSPSRPIGRGLDA